MNRERSCECGARKAIASPTFIETGVTPTKVTLISTYFEITTKEIVTCCDMAEATEVMEEHCKHKPCAGSE